MTAANHDTAYRVTRHRQMAKATSDSGLWIVPAPPKPAKATAGPASAPANPANPSAAASAPLKGTAGGATVWLDGNVLTCACPDCGAPISIRLWLMLADCWRCGTSVELTEEQQRLAQQLLDKANKTAAAVAAALPATAKPQPAKPLPAAIVEPPKPRSTVPVAAIAAPPVVAPVAAPPKPSSVPPPLPASHRKSNLPVAKLVSAPTRVVRRPLLRRWLPKSCRDCRGRWMPLLAGGGGTGGWRRWRRCCWPAWRSGCG